MLGLVKVPGPVEAGGAGGTGGAGGDGGGTGVCVCYAAVYTACHRFMTSSIRSFAVYGADSDTGVTWLYRS